MNTRQLILRILADFDRNPGNLERIVDRGLHGQNIEHRDRRFVFEIVFGIIRHRLTIDHTINHFVIDEQNRENGALRRLLQLGVYQIMYMDRVPDHAAVNETVNLSKIDVRTRPLSGIINAVLRKLINNKRQVPLPDPQKDLVERLSIEYSHPRWMVERWLSGFGLAKTRKLLAFDNEKPVTYLRRKYRDISRQQFEAEVKAFCDPATGYLNLYYKMNKPLATETIQLIQQGLCVVQSPSSGWTVAMLDVQRNDHLLDMCAAPGGKTTLMAELASDKGTVVSCEIKMSRLKDVLTAADRLNLRNVYPLLCDSSQPPFAGHFDKILIDAPCTSTGVIQRHPDARWTRTVADIQRLSETQAKLLDSAATLLGRNGILVYSTCSLEPEENEQQVESFLKRNTSFVLERCPDQIPDRYVDMKGYLRITPFDDNLDGMFAARMRKVD